MAHTVISCAVDHLPYERQEAINAKPGVYSPRSTLATPSGRAGAAMEPMYEAHECCRKLAPWGMPETPVAMLVAECGAIYEFARTAAR